MYDGLRNKILSKSISKYSKKFNVDESIIRMYMTDTDMLDMQKEWFSETKAIAVKYVLKNMRKSSGMQTTTGTVAPLKPSTLKKREKMIKEGMNVARYGKSTPLRSTGSLYWAFRNLKNVGDFKAKSVFRGGHYGDTGIITFALKDKYDWRFEWDIHDAEEGEDIYDVYHAMIFGGQIMFTYMVGMLEVYGWMDYPPRDFMNWVFGYRSYNTAVAKMIAKDIANDLAVEMI